MVDNMDKNELKEYLKENLSLEVTENSHGFNGEHIDIKLLLEGEEISSDWIVTREDEG